MPTATKPRKTKTAAAKTAALAESAARLALLRAQTKSAYEEIDRLEAELLAVALPADGQTLRVAGWRIEARDNFVDREGRPTNKAWKPACITRWALSLTPDTAS